MVPTVLVLEQLGGVATWTQLVRASSRWQLERAVAADAVVRVARGRYALPTAREARVAAHRITGIAVLQSAAAHWGWGMKWQPRRPQVAVGRGRRITAEVQAAYAVQWRSLPASDVVDGWVTSPLRTVVDCAAVLPFDEALAIADSALRSRLVTRAQLLAAAAQGPGRGRARVLRVARLADPRAANAFESVLRAIVLDIPGITVVPQVRIEDGGRFLGRVDLADRRLGIVLEAEGFEFHGESEMLDRDCARYDELVVRDWLVLRFSWLQVMRRPGWVREMVSAGVALRVARLRAA